MNDASYRVYVVRRDGRPLTRTAVQVIESHLGNLIADLDRHQFDVQWEEHA